MKTTKWKKMRKGVVFFSILTLGVIFGASFVLQDPGFFSRNSWAQGKPLKIGVLEPLSGVYAEAGQRQVKGKQMGFEQFGSEVARRPIKLIVEDTELNPQVALRKARKLVESDEVDLLMGIISSGVAYAMKDYATRSKKILVLTAGGADGIMRKANYSPYVFGVRAATWQVSAPIGRWLARKYKRVFITGPDYALGIEMSKGFKDGWLKAGGPPPVGEVLAPLNTNDYAPYLTQIKNANPDCVFASFASGDSVRFVKQFDEFGLKKQILLTGFGYLTDEDNHRAQGDSAIGVMTCFNSCYTLNTPENKKFVEEYKNRYKDNPSQDDYNGFTGAMIVYQALKELKGNTSDQLALSKAIQKLDMMVPPGRIRFDPITNNPIYDVYIREARKVGG
jgi:branched-chain amino acid transport system substrate-binding protein